MAIAFVFPGQGSQDVGMGKALADAFPCAKEVFDEVDAALGQKLSAIMWEGPKDTLTLTENAQPALMAVSMAVMRVLEREKGFKLAERVKFVAGHSLGEYSALAAAGAFSLADTARLLKLRGQAMQKAVPVGQGAMAALLGVGMDVAAKVAEDAAQGDCCQVANDNEPTQVVLSGHKTAIDRVIGEIGKEHGVRRAMPLPVSAPFHCALMQPAAEAMAEALSKVDIKAPVVPVVANVLAAADLRPGRDQEAPRRAGDRHRALARMRAVHGGERRHRRLRDRHWQGAGRARQAHRAVVECHEPRRAGRHRCGHCHRCTPDRG